MRLIGAKEFLKTVKPGTLCCEFWKNEEICRNIIEEYENGIDILTKYEGEFYLFGDNSFSLAFLYDEEENEIFNIYGIDYDCLFCYDKNIVGDASPTSTLQLVFDSEDEWPEQIKIQLSEKTLTKEDVKRIQKYYLETEIFGDNSWAMERLETDEYFKDDFIINYKGE